MFKLLHRFLEKSPTLFWIAYAIIWIVMACAGLIFTYWAGRKLYELIFT